MPAASAPISVARWEWHPHGPTPVGAASLRLRCGSVCVVGHRCKDGRKDTSAGLGAGGAPDPAAGAHVRAIAVHTPGALLAGHAACWCGDGKGVSSGGRESLNHSSARAARLGYELSPRDCDTPAAAGDRPLCDPRLPRRREQVRQLPGCLGQAHGQGDIRLCGALRPQ